MKFIAIIMFGSSVCMMVGGIIMLSSDPESIAGTLLLLVSVIMGSVGFSMGLHQLSNRLQEPLLNISEI
jgi:hypothetical protein